MPATANSGGGRRHGGLTDALPEGSLALLARLDREIEDLRQAAPPGYEKTVAGLSATMLEIHEALGLPSVAERR
jgi:hypothetical protein